MPGATSTTGYQYNVLQPCANLSALVRPIQGQAPEAISGGAFNLEEVSGSDGTNSCNVYVNFDAASDARNLAQGYTEGVNRMWGGRKKGDPQFIQDMQRVASNPTDPAHALGASYMEAQGIIEGKTSSKVSEKPGPGLLSISDPVALLAAIPTTIQVPPADASIEDYNTWYSNTNVALMALYSLTGSTPTNVSEEYQNLSGFGLSIDGEKHKYVESDSFGFRYETNLYLDTIGSQLQSLESNLNTGLENLQAKVDSLQGSRSNADVEARVAGSRILTEARKLTASTTGVSIDMGGPVTVGAVRETLNQTRQSLDANFTQAREQYKKDNPIKQPKSGGGGPSAASTSDE